MGTAGTVTKANPGYGYCYGTRSRHFRSLRRRWQARGRDGV